MAMPRGTGGMFFGPAGNGPIQPDGTFTLSGVAPGEYTLRANIGNGMGGSDGRPEFATADRHGQRRGHQRRSPGRHADDHGDRRIIVQDPAAAQALKTPIRINADTPANPDDQMIMMGGGNTTVKDDYTFEMKAAAGKTSDACGRADVWLDDACGPAQRHRRHRQRHRIHAGR